MIHGPQRRDRAMYGHPTGSASSLEKGMRMIATGRIRQWSYVTPGRREAHRLRDPRGRRRPEPQQGHGEGRPVQPLRQNGQAAAAVEASRDRGNDPPPF